MKNYLALACAAVFFTASTASALNELAFYKAADVVVSGTTMTWNDTKGVYGLELSDSTGVTIGDKPDIGDDTKSVVFSGEQNQPFRSTGGLELPKSALKVSLLFKPSSDTATDDQTLLRHGSWELRYSLKRQSISFIVWHDGGTTSAVGIPLSADMWHQVTASFEQGVLSLDVDGKIATREASGDLMQGKNTSGLVIGAVKASRPSDGDNFRALCGALAEIKIFVE